MFAGKILQIVQNLKENACVTESFLIFLMKLQAWVFIKKDCLAQVFSCEFCEISKNTFFYRTPPVAVSVTGHLRTTASDT